MSGSARTYYRHQSDRRTAAPETKPETIIEIARYIADMTNEMSRLAGNAKLELLAYFLSMARVESEMIARRTSTKTEIKGGHE